MEDNTREYRRHVRAFAFLRWLCMPFVKWKFNLSCEDISDIEGPYLLLSNHNTDFDPAFLGQAMKKQAYFVATENITRMGLAGRFLVYFLRPIIHYKGRAGINTVKEILRELKSGHNVCMFPEGNRSFNGLTNPIVATTGRLAKKSGASLVTYRLDGGYFSSPRWSCTFRKGKITGKKVHVYTPDMLRLMSENEINEAIRKDLYVDAYAEQEREPVRYRGRNLAEGIESAVFMCPRCRRIGTMHGNGNDITCTCGFHAVYDEYGYLQEDSGKKVTVTEIDAQQQKLIESLLTKDADEVLFSDSVTAQEIDNATHAVISSSEVKMTAFPGRFTIGEEDVPFSEITGLSIHTRNTLIMYCMNGAKHIDIKGPASFSALKYLYLYQKSLNHRDTGYEKI